MITYDKVQPTGWLKKYLQTQMSGLTGHMSASGFPFDRQFWGNPNPQYDGYRGIFWWPYEQTAYHIDGYVRTAILLNDFDAIKKAESIIYSVINNPDKDGYLGPIGCKERIDEYTRWAHVVFFRACIALYNYNHDINIISALEKHYINVPFDYSEMRNVLNIEIMLDVYAVTKNPKLLELSKKSFDIQCQKSNEEYEALDKNDKSSKLKEIYSPRTLANIKPLYVHGVSYNEYAKLGALLYAHTKEKKYLKLTIKAYEKIKRLYMLPGGVNSSTERLRSNNYYECAETCDSADMTWSLENLLAITSIPEYGDMIEKCVFNAGIGCVTEDFKALQYFSCSNQLVLDQKSSHSEFSRGNAAMAYSPAPMTQCCPGNLNRIVPNYILNMWQTKKDTVYANLFGPSVFNGMVNNELVEIKEETHYPFDFKISFSIKTKNSFKFKVRIPSWCTGKVISNSEYVVDNGYLLFNVSNSTLIKVEFPCEIKKVNSNPGVYYQYGPVVYSIGMKGTRTIISSKNIDGKEFNAYAITPDKKWNYAFDSKSKPIFVKGSVDSWDLDDDICHIDIDAYEITNFNITTSNNWYKYNSNYEKVLIKNDPRVFTPKLPNPKKAVFSNNKEKISLYPYGASKVRMTVMLEK